MERRLAILAGIGVLVLIVVLVAVAFLPHAPQSLTGSTGGGPSVDQEINGFVKPAIESVFGNVSEIRRISLKQGNLNIIYQTSRPVDEAGIDELAGKIETRYKLLGRNENSGVNVLAFSNSGFRLTITMRVGEKTIGVAITKVVI